MMAENNGVPREEITKMVFSRYGMAACFLALAGCTMSSAGLSQSGVDLAILSTKSAQSFATCSAESMMGNVQLRNDGDHYWVLRLNTVGVPTARWDFRPQEGGGSRAELRSSIPINTGDERVRSCS